VAFGFRRGSTGRISTGVAAYINLLFSRAGLIIVAYILIGVFTNTAPPHLPVTAASWASLHSWVQYFISIFFWPLSYWHPLLSVGKWIPIGSIIIP
jgi:hypothetical protein